MRRRPIIGGILCALVVLTAGAGCGGDTATSVNDAPQVELNYWRVFDEDDAFDEIIAAYQLEHPNVRINYRKFRVEEYEDALVRAMAEGNGPDIFTVHNSKLREFQSLMAPLPPSLTTTRVVTRGSLRKETVLETQTRPTLTVRQMQDQFVDVVADDVILPYQPDEDEPAVERIFGIPLAVDTLALFYNRALLNAAGVAQPPATWDDMLAAVRQVTRIDPTNDRIVQSAVAMGTSRNVDRAVDILAALMLQTGVRIEDDRGRPALTEIPAGTEQGVHPTMDALRFYTDFANPTTDAYTWNETFPQSFTAFANGATAMFFGYSYHIPLLRAAAPRLDYGIAALPQTGGRVANVANYWVESVAKDSPNAAMAWDFVLFAASPEHVGDYLANTGKPTALRALIEQQLQQDSVATFTRQLLTAQSWYHGRDADAATEAFADLVDDVAALGINSLDPLRRAQRVIDQTYTQ